MDVNQDTLARTMYGEARNQERQGLQAIANVVMNRVARQTWFGLTVYEVCKKPKQFTCWNDDDPNLPVIESVTATDKIFAVCLDIAAQAIAGTLLDLTDGATHYRRIGTPASWDKDNCLTPCITIGDHEFFNDVP